MKKLLILAIFCMTAALVLPVLVSAADAPADPITMDKGGKGVVFQHSTHTKDACTACHHPVDGKEDYRSCMTDGCHPLEGGPPAPYKTLKGILHNKKPAEGYTTCLSCHIKAAKDAGMDKAATDKMTKCNDSNCHPKK